MTDIVTIAFEHRAVVDRWEFIQKYANEFSLDIKWNGELLVVSGDSPETGKLIDDLAEIIYPEALEHEFIWNNFWNCELQINSAVYQLGIEADEDEEPRSLQRYKAAASRRLSELIPELKDLATDKIYPFYVEKFSSDRPCSRTEFKEALQVSGQIIYAPPYDRYEFCFSAAPLIETHVINVGEKGGVPYPPRLEWA